MQSRRIPSLNPYAGSVLHHRGTASQSNPDLLLLRSVALCLKVISSLRGAAPLLYRKWFLAVPFMADRNEFSTPSSSSVLETHVDATSPRFEANMRFLADVVSQMRNEEEKIREGGGLKA